MAYTENKYTSYVINLMVEKEIIEGYLPKYGEFRITSTGIKLKMQLTG